MAKKIKNARDDRRALEAPQTAEIGFFNNHSIEHPEIGLTPLRMSRLLIEAEQGNLTAQADLFYSMEERDGHIFSEMDKRRRGTIGLSWGVNAPVNASTLEKKIAQQVTEWINEVKAWESVLFEATDAIGHGYSCQEIQWERVENLWLPASIEHVLAREFQTPYSQPNELRLRDGSMDGAEFYAHGWFIHKHKAKSGYISRSGLHRVLSWPFLFKNYSIRDILEFLEIYGLPLRIGKYPNGATPEEKNTLLKAVISIGRNAGGIVPEGMSIDFENAVSGSTDNHMGFIKWCEQTQSKVIVGGTLLSQADGKTSTNAQGSIHEEQFNKLVKADALQLARSINDYLVASMMSLNYPSIDPRRYPVFYFDTADTEDIKIYSEALPKLATVMEIPDAWAREKLGIPKRKDGEPILTIQQPPQQILAANTQLLPAQLTPVPFTADSVPYDQVLLDAFIKEKTENSAEVYQSWTQSLFDAIQKEDDPTQILALLSDLHPDADEPVLQEMLTKMIFTADVFGRLVEQAEHE